MRWWSEDELNFLKKEYAETRNKDLSKYLQRSIPSIKYKAQSLGLYKTKQHRSNAAKTASIETQFKKGESKNNLPVGSERLSYKGYFIRKISDSVLPKKSRWVPVHVINWISANGAVPKGHFLDFIDGNKKNPALENIRLVKVSEHLKKYSFHNYPDEIVRVIQIIGALNRRINSEQKSK